MPDISELKAHILGLETSLHDIENRHSREVLERLLAPGFREFGRSGRVYDRDNIIHALLEEEADQAALPDVSDVALTLLAENCVLLTYRTVRHGDAASLQTLRSSIWSFEEGAWRMVFHQGTAA